MKIYVAAMKNADGSGSEWKEEFTEEDDFKFEEWVKTTLEAFNSSLRPGERERELVSWAVEGDAPEEDTSLDGWMHFQEWAMDAEIDDDDLADRWVCWKAGYDRGVEEEADG